MTILRILQFIVVITLLGFTDPSSVNQMGDEDPQTVILISIDGLRADYLTRGVTPNILKLSEEGVHAKYLEPIFPSKTFPNHYSIITGLYPANHGIVNNSMYDPELGFFRLSDREVISKSSWWGGEPLWITVQKHGHSKCHLFLARLRRRFNSGSSTNLLDGI